MKLQCSAQELITGLVNATRALNARPATQVLECVKLATGEDEIFLTCTDGSLTIRARVKAQVEEPGEVLLPGKLFAEIARKLPEGTVTINMNEKLVTTIKCASSRSTLTGMPVSDFPKTLDLINTHALHVPQKRLRDMINRVVFAIAVQESRQTLTGCLMEVTRTELRLVGLDGFRLALQRMHGDFILPDGQSTVKAIIPGHVMGEMSRIMDDDNEAMITFHMDGTHLMAIIDDTTLITSLLAGEYINYRQILPEKWLTRVTVKRAELSDAIERASLMAPRRQEQPCADDRQQRRHAHHLHERTGRCIGGTERTSGGRGNRNRLQRPLHQRRGQEYRRRLLHAVHEHQCEPVRRFPGGWRRIPLSGASGARSQLSARDLTLNIEFYRPEERFPRSVFVW